MKDFRDIEIEQGDTVFIVTKESAIEERHVLHVGKQAAVVENVGEKKNDRAKPFGTISASKRIGVVRRADGSVPT